jgi:hypothetical protein
MIGGSASIDIIGALHTNQGFLRIDAGRNLVTAGTLTNSGTTVVGGQTAQKVSGDLTNTGTIDVSGGLIVDYATSSPIAAIESQIANARNGGAWDQSGITSSAAREASPPITTLGVIEGSDFQAIHGAGAAFFDLPIDSTSVLVKYTYYGDTDFNGVVDFDDYVRLDAGFNGGLSGWLNGDFDLNGVIDFDDYVLIDAAFNGQSGPPGGTLVTPEPASGFPAVALLVLDGMRRRRARRRRNHVIAKSVTTRSVDSHC